MFGTYQQQFIGCESTFEDSEIVLFGAPFDGTTSYRPGTRFASAAMRSQSYSIETYSPYLDRDLAQRRICDSGELELPFGNTLKALSLIEERTAAIFDAGKIPLMIGGEHLVTLGAMRAAAARYDNLHIVHFDAHTDLRDEYLGETLSHATVMRRCWELIGDRKIFQYGIRSGERAEFEWAKRHVFLNRFNFDGISRLPTLIGQNPVYFTIDLDVLDPSEFPGTGTPEAGGVHFHALLDAVSEVMKLNVIGADLNELSPPYDPSGISTSLACKLLREVLLQL